MDKPCWKADIGAPKGILAALLLLIPSTAGARGGDGAIVTVADRSSAASIDRWTPHIAEASGRFGIPGDWIRRVMRAESGGLTVLHGRPITSRAGAMGLMQLMPATWSDMRAKHGLGQDPHHPRDNILAGAAYLRAMFDRFGYPDLFAAYHAGPARYAGHLAGGRKLPAETIAYVAAVGSSPSRAAANVAKGLPEAGIFVSLLTVRQGDIEVTSSAGELFVRLSSVPVAIE